MKEIVTVIGLWFLGAYAGGMVAGYLGRLLACIAFCRQDRAYLESSHRPTPKGARRAVATANVIVCGGMALAVGVLGARFGIHPPGMQGFTAWAHVIIVWPGCLAGVTLGSALAVSKGPLQHWAPILARFQAQA